MGLSLVLSAMESDELDPHEVIAGSHAVGHVEVMPSSVGNHGIDSPSAPIQTTFGNLEPLQTAGSCGGGVVNLGEVDHDRTW